MASLFAPTAADVRSQQQLLPQHPVPYREQAAISVAIQTDMRETAAQTDPWSAPLDQNADGLEHQDLRSLIELTFASGLLPAHQGTMAVIERIQQEKQFDAAIPPPMDPTKKPTEADLEQEQRRVEMLVQKDLKEWERREKDIQAVHGRRIMLLVEQLVEREAARQELRIDRLSKLTEQKSVRLQEQSVQLAQKAIAELKKNTVLLQKQLDAQLSFSQLNVYSDRVIRQAVGYQGPQLTLPQQPSTKKLVQQSIFSANPLNAPAMRPGEAPQRFAGVIKLAGTELKTDEDFAEIIKFSKINMANERLSVKQPLQQKTQTYSVSKETGYLPYRMVERREGHRVIPPLGPPDTRPEWLRGPRRATYKQAAQQPTQGLQATTAGKAAPATVAYYKCFEAAPDISESARQDACLFLQNLLRGKATQNKLAAGKDRRIGLVNELRLAHELVTARSSDQAMQRLAEDRIRLIKEAVVAGVVVQGAAATIGQSVDQIAKDRIRSQQLNRAQALLQIALRERQRRETMEADQRQKEILRRSRRDYGRQIIHEAHREFVDMLIDGISKRSVEADAQAQAKDLALRQVEALVELDYQTSKQATQTGFQDQLEQYLQDFLLPEVDRQFQLQKIQHAQQKWLTAGLLGSEAAHVATRRVEQNAQMSAVGQTEINSQGVLLVEGAEAGDFRGVDAETEAKFQGQ